MNTLWIALLAIACACAAAPRVLATSPHVQVRPELPEIRDKTLVSWVTLADHAHRGGSILTIEARDVFDAVVMGEVRPGAWMAGSEVLRRTELDQSRYPVETAGPDELVRIAAVYRGDTITLYRNDAVIAAYRAGAPVPMFVSGAAILIGLRHVAREGGENSYFAGSVEEARLYDRALSGAEIAALRPGATSGPRPLGRWTFERGSTRDAEGVFPPGVLHGGAHIRAGRLILNGTDAYFSTPTSRKFASTLHYRPRVGCAADPIPFYWKGEYHVFYLQAGVGRVPWKHIVSRNLVDWRELPDALVTDGAPDGPDGGEMFTGSVVEHSGTFHIFYTGHNPANPAGTEVIRHATSPDLITWTKDPAIAVRPDGRHYAAGHDANWRDPYVFWNPGERRWWMVVIADDAGGAGGRQGLLVSEDLRTWTQEPPLAGGRGEECPDLFESGGRWWMLGAGRLVAAATPRGPYAAPAHDVVDFPGIYAGKRMFDGQRHIWVGWAWDGQASRDAAVAAEGVLTWGGTLCLPRELSAGAGGELHCAPAREIVALHSRTASAAPAGSGGPLDLPDVCMVECTVQAARGAEVTLVLREQPDGSAYRLTVRPDRGEIALATPASEWVRRGCRFVAGQPILLRAFLDASMMECFVDDAWAITRRAYDLGAGRVRVEAHGGPVEVRSLSVRTPARPARIVRPGPKR